MSAAIVEPDTGAVWTQARYRGMSDRLGPVAFGRKYRMILLGRDIGEQKDYSEHVGELIDDEIRRLIDQSYARATSILHQYRDLLDRLARELIGKETLDAPALEHIFQMG